MDKVRGGMETGVRESLKTARERLRPRDSTSRGMRLPAVFVATVLR
jgi:hypothetical protein